MINIVETRLISRWGTVPLAIRLATFPQKSITRIIMSFWPFYTKIVKKIPILEGKYTNSEIIPDLGILEGISLLETTMFANHYVKCCKLAMNVKPKVILEERISSKKL